MQSCRAGVGLAFLLAAIFVCSRPIAASETTLALDGAKWPGGPIKISISKSLDASPNIQGEVREAFDRSLSVWSAVSTLRFAIGSSELLSISRKGVRGDGVSLVTAAPTAENSALFPNAAKSPAAMTRVFTDGRGRIIEADIVLNPFVRFSTDGAFETYDLENTLAHEIGHLLGLGHSTVLASIMYERGSKSTSPAGLSESQRLLPRLDAAAIRSLYGPEDDNFGCCGSVSGLVARLARYAKTLVWIEEPDSGRLIAAGSPDADGTYMVGGIPEGEYSIRVFSTYLNGKVSGAESKLSVSPFETERITLTLSEPMATTLPDLLGNSFRLGRAAVRVSSTNPSLVIGGRVPLDGIVRIGISGTDRWFVASGPIVFNQNESVRVLQFDLSSLVGSSHGEYSVVLVDNKGVASYLPGALILP